MNGIEKSKRHKWAENAQDDNYGMIKTSTIQLSDLRKQESAAHSRSRVEGGDHSRGRAGSHCGAGMRLVHTVRQGWDLWTQQGQGCSWCTQWGRAEAGAHSGGRAADGTHSEAKRWFVCQVVHLSHCWNIRVITMAGYSYRGFTS